MKLLNLPGSIVNKIMMYDSHPCADLINEQLNLKQKSYNTFTSILKLHDFSITTERLNNFTFSKSFSVWYFKRRPKPKKEFEMEESDDEN